MKTILRSGFLALALLALTVPALAAEWVRYTNPRFGATADVPTEGFIANPPPDNGDGQSWTSEDGKGLITVYGSFAAIVETFEAYRDWSIKIEKDGGLDITYDAGGRGWFAYSGIQGDDIVYNKVIRAENCSVLVANHVYLKYPASQKGRYDPIVRRMAKSLTSELGWVCD